MRGTCAYRLARPAAPRPAPKDPMTLTNAPASETGERLAAARVEGLSKVYGAGETRVVALDDVTLDLYAGEFTAIMGKSGSGKSTLMHCAAGLDDATTGHVFLGDVDLTTLKEKHLTELRRDRIGFVFQAFNLVPTLTAQENILLPSAIAGRRPDPAWFDEVIDTVGLRDRLGHRPSELSGGQQQRVACARALVGRPDDRLRRRAHRQPRLDVGRRGARVPAPGRRHPRPDRRHGDPRPGRRELDRPGGLPRRRPRRRRAARTDPRARARADGGARPASSPGADRVLRATWRSLFARKLRLFLSAFAVMLGVAFVSGSYVFTDTLGQAFTGLTSGAVGDVIVRPGTSADSGGGFGGGTSGARTVPASLVDELAAVPGAARADGRITNFGTFVVGKDGKLIGGSGPPGIAVNYTAGPGRPTGCPSPPSSAAAGPRPRARSSSTTRPPSKAGYLVGRDGAPGHRHRAAAASTARLVGTAAFGGSTLVGASVVMFDTAQAQDLFLQGEDAFSQVWVTAAPGTSQEQLLAAVTKALPKDTQAATGDATAARAASRHRRGAVVRHAPSCSSSPASP